MYGRIALVALGLILAAVGAYELGVFGGGGEAPETMEVSPAVAASAEAKLAQLAQEQVEVRLTDAELTSLFRYRPEVWKLGPVVNLQARLLGDTLELTGGVPADSLSHVRQLESVRNFLPDTTAVTVRGAVRTYPPQTALDLLAVELAGMPVPSHLYPVLLVRLGLEPDRTLPASAIALPLPAGISAARVENGELVLSP